MSTKKNARELALEALQRCRRQGAWSSQLIDSLLHQEGLDPRECALAVRLFLGVLQNSLFFDHYIGVYCTRPLHTLQPNVLDILRLGACQLLLFDKIPAHAAVDESVALCRRRGLDRAAGLVNAVLRKLAQNREALPEIPGKGSAEYLSTRYSHPLWLVRRLIDEQGSEETEAFLAANNADCGFWIHVNTLRISAEDYRRALQRSGIGFETRADLPDAFLIPGGSVTQLPGYEEGLFYVQDAAARLAVLLAGPAPGMKILDACAAPGGKSIAAAIACGGQCSIRSADIHEKKLALMERNLRRLGICCVETLQRDARREVPEERGLYDLVLADVPCSGLGVIRHRPEIRYKTEEELAALPQIQADILDSLSSLVKPGGLLLYSTCTVLYAENRGQVEAFLQRHPEFQLDACERGAHVHTDGCCAFWPQRDGTDGFFAARLRKRRDA